MTTTTLNDQKTSSSPGRKSRIIVVFHYLKRNTNLAIGLIMLLLLLLFTLIGSFMIDPDNAYPGAVRAARPPSIEFPFGTDIHLSHVWVMSGISFAEAGRIGRDIYNDGSSRAQTQEEIDLIDHLTRFPQEVAFLFVFHLFE